ncbi:hypothetical protein KL86DES1_10396 [uncultured Desulfovibrio sp.]|uniref:Uncharacterized protein n=1 Tax=uncultured Desulfovibrio sp. TaxID=167968 RepID=A0A212KYQ5_9BACT|nr:hypothetical protein KL86DES1_10396 [uncultured Desulfovibrio sp.]VZH32269.1 conserved protein of unknown function [Desulfovibrio sp. 86]
MMTGRREGDLPSSVSGPEAVPEANTLKIMVQSSRQYTGPVVFGRATSGYCIIFATMAHYL